MGRKELYQPRDYFLFLRVDFRPPPIVQTSVGAAKKEISGFYQNIADKGV